MFLGQSSMVMASPYSTGGGGTHFEAKVTAYYLAATLARAPALGVPAQYVTEVLTQRAAFGAPLDDLVVKGATEDGSAATLHLQVKSDLAFTPSDDEWVATLGLAWDTLGEPFNSLTDRLGVAISAYSARADKHYQTVLKWASASVDASHFFARLSQRDFSHKDMREFVSNTRSILAAHAGRTIADEELWQLLRCFVILHFDFARDESRDLGAAQDRIRAVLSADRRQQAGAVWSFLVEQAGELAPVGGGANRETLQAELAKASLPNAVDAGLWRNILAVHRESDRALGQIKADIHGLRLNREAIRGAVREALQDGRFIQIDGEPGSGKSALLREIAEEAARMGPLFVLKDSRIQPRGWPAHAAMLGVTADLVALLGEFAGCGTPILFIDGIDKITDPAVQLTVNDLVTAISKEPRLGAWRILATVREQNLQHIATWLDPDALKRLPVRTVTVPALDDNELLVIAAAFLRLRPLLLETGPADMLLRRPFFVEAILGLAEGAGGASLPATEVQLLKLWWELGGSERRDFSPAQHRRNILLALAERLAEDPDRPISIRHLAPEPLEDLKSAGVIRDKELGHSVIFAHDIYEEWALSEMLIGMRTEIATLLPRLHEPQLLVRPLQLFASSLLEDGSTEEAWRLLYGSLGKSQLRPVWQRAVLVSTLRSTRTGQLLDKLQGFLSENDNENLKKLLLALQTLEVVPNPTFLDEKSFPDLEPSERVQLAHHTALPKFLVWLRFFDWYFGHGEPEPALISDLLPVFSTWQRACAGHSVRHSDTIGKISFEWLREFEAARHVDRFENRRDPFGIDFDYHEEKEVEKSIRTLFLGSAGDVPELVAAYLKDASSRPRRHMVRDEILSNSTAIAKHLPTEIVDYVLAAFFAHPEDDGRRRSSTSPLRELGLMGMSKFYPASPYQSPFLVLLRFHEAEGHRLVRSICNHCIDVWRWEIAHGDSYRGPAIPIPVELEFAWGKQTFWGDGQVYTWFRGNWGNAATASALMALELWAFERIDAGDDFAEVFRKVVEGNKSVGVLGLATSLALAYQGQSIELALPLVTEIRIWEWDIARSVTDQASPSNEIGDWFRHKHLLQAVRDLNSRPHRAFEIRSLVPYYVLWHDQVLRDRYAEAVQKFAQASLFSYEEERGDPEHVAALRKKATWYWEQATPEFWRTEFDEDSGQYKIWNDPPSANSEERLAHQQRFALLNKCVGLSLWAEKAREEGKVGDSFSIADALRQAQELDQDDLFDIYDDEELTQERRKAAVAGVAYAVAKFSSDESWTEERAAWCLDVIQRAATTPNAQSPYKTRGMLLIMDSAVFAAYGYAALLGRGSAIEAAQCGILSLAVDPMEGIISAVAASAADYAQAYPDFYWVMFALLVRSCVAANRDIPSDYSSVWDEAEATACDELPTQAETALIDGKLPILPSIPLPWIKGEASNEAVKDGEYEDSSGTGGYRRNDDVFLWHVAEKAIFPVQLAAILTDPWKRAQFLALLGQLVEYTVQEIVPPFAKRRRDRSGDTPFQWVFQANDWLGRIATHLEPDEIDELFGPVAGADNETALLIAHSFVPSFMINGLLVAKPARPEILGVWKKIAEWLLQNPETRRLDGEYLDRDFSAAAMALLLCVHGDFGPIVCGIEEGWAELPNLLPTLERAVRTLGVNETLYLAVMKLFDAGGFDLLPDPALAWLRDIVIARKADQDFWQKNGDDTVKLLTKLLDQKEAVLSDEHRGCISLIVDILVDNGVRGAGFLQQERLRA
jgi:hypothetical protein